MSRLLVGPFNRVEGDLEIKLEYQQQRVSSAQVNSPLYRGFERILLGQDPIDALVYTPRICGICSVSQSAACAAALADLMQISMPLNGQLCSNLVVANENMADLLSHFYLFFMPDFARPIYAEQPWFTEVERRFKATQGTASRSMLPARAEFLHLMGLLAGKWPHTLSLQPGGTSKPVEPQERIRLLAIIAAFRRFLETELFGDNLETIASLASHSDLQYWRQQKPWQSSDFRAFLHLSEQLELHQLGRGTDQFLSYGSYPQGEGKLFGGGYHQSGQTQPLNIEAITEDVSHSWLQGDGRARHPTEGITQPLLDNPEAYSWCKSPRLDGQVVEVGALARQRINGHPLAVDLISMSGANVHSRIVARLLELALVIPKMQEWVKQIDPKAPFCHHAPLPDSGRGVGLIEAARGSLGHWLEVDKGKISNYQIIAPTSWNFSPRDQQGIPGALEQALQGAPIRAGETDPIAVQHIVRSFDPCMACTVH